MDSSAIIERMNRESRGTLGKFRYRVYWYRRELVGGKNAY